MSELLFLGTGAADWHIEDKGDFFRRNSAALLNGNMMLDCGSHIFDFAVDMEESELYSDVCDILITHNHSDHFSTESVKTLAKTRKIRLGCTRAVMEKTGENPNIEYVILKPFEEVDMGEYKVIPLLANHDVVINEKDAAFHYIIKTPEGKCLFYGLDGAWFLRPSWAEMKKHKFDVMVFDATVGDRDDWRIFEHNTIPMLRFMMKEIKEQNMLKEGGYLVASHLARTLHESHEKTADILKELDMLTAFDGMRIYF